jgi:hypothetical protein
MVVRAVWATRGLHEIAYGETCARSFRRPTERSASTFLREPPKIVLVSGPRGRMLASPGHDLCIIGLDITTVIDFALWGVAAL